MNADAFRMLYDYHFSENRATWERYIVPLTYEQFAEPVDYSHGSIRDQVVHLMSVDEIWFKEIHGDEPPPEFPAAQADDRALIRAHWDEVERYARGYLATLRDEMLFTKPISLDEDKDLILWQVLIQVVNHGTDHRAQLLRVLHDLDVKTVSQDFIFYVYEHQPPAAAQSAN